MSHGAKRHFEFEENNKRMLGIHFFGNAPLQSTEPGAWDGIIFIYFSPDNSKKEFL
jgi:hypothetical protein